MVKWSVSVPSAIHRHACALSVLLLLLGGCSDRAVTRSVALHECRLAKLASAAQCAIVNVPEDRLKPDGRTLALFVAVLPANTLSPDTDPLFMLAGGPGQSVEALVPVAGALAGVRRTRDIVLIDPRGTGKSAPLKCAALAPRDPFDELIDADLAATAAQRCLAELRELRAPDNIDVSPRSRRRSAHWCAAGGFARLRFRGRGAARARVRTRARKPHTAAAQSRAGGRFRAAAGCRHAAYERSRANHESRSVLCGDMRRGRAAGDGERQQQATRDAARAIVGGAQSRGLRRLAAPVLAGRLLSAAQQRRADTYPLRRSRPGDATGQRRARCQVAFEQPPCHRGRLRPHSISA